MTSNNAALQLVPFHGQNIEAVRGPDGAPWVVIKRICENLGIAYQRQHEKLRSQPWAVITMMVTTGPDGKNH